MPRRKSTAAPPSRPIAAPEPDRDDFTSSRPLTRKQVMEMLRRKESFEEADLRGCDLAGLNFEGVKLDRAKLAEANLSRCNFNRSSLRGTSFFAASLKDATLEEADLEEADFDYAWLDGVSLRGAKVRKAAFPYKKLSIDDVQESVRTGKKLRMEQLALDDDD